jgi:hypothetical protein
MADITVYGPDGASITFPQGTATADIEKVMADRYPESPGTGGAVYGDTQQPITRGQERALQAMGGIDPLLPVGSGRNPRFQAPGNAPADTGTYINPRGQTIQNDYEPISKTLLAAGSRVLGIGRRLDGSRAPWAQSNTVDAFESGMVSAALLGGKNELGAIPEGLGSMMRGQGFKAGFAPALDAADARDAELRGNHPYAYYGGGALGTAATAALTPSVKAGGMLTRALGNGAIQGAQGAVAGYLGTDGTTEDRFRGALIGGTLGEMLGAVGGLINPPPRINSQMTTQLPAGVPIPAAQRAARYVERQSKIPMDQLETFSGNPNFTAAEVMGQRGKRALGGLGSQEGTTPDAFEELVLQRAEQRPARLMDQFTGATGLTPEEAKGDIEAIVSAGQKEVKPLFDAAKANPNPVTSPRLAAILETPEGKKAAKQVYADMMNDIDGPHPQAVGFEVTGATPDGLPEMVMARAPTMDAWDRIYKQLGRQVERDPFGKPLADSVSPGNANINKLRAAARKELGDQSLEWDEAMLKSGDYKAAESAFALGSKNLFNSGMTAREFARGVERLTPAERRAAIAGQGNAIFERAQKGTLRPGTFKPQIVKDKLRALMGKDAADKLIAAAEDEARMMHFENRFGPNGNSKTADIKQAIKEQNDNPWKEAGTNALLAAPFGPKAMAFGAGMVPVRRLAAKFGEPKAEAWRDYAGELMLGAPRTTAEAIKGIPRKNNPIARGAQVGAQQALRRMGGRFGDWSTN